MADHLTPFKGIFLSSQPYIINRALQDCGSDIRCLRREGGRLYFHREDWGEVVYVTDAEILAEKGSMLGLLHRKFEIEL